MSIWHITKANLKKKKSGALALGLLILLAIVFMNLGLGISTTIGDFFERKAESLGGPDLLAISSINTYKGEYEDFLKQDPRVALYEKEDVIYMSQLKAELSGMDMAAYIFDANQERELARLEPVEELAGEEGIYLPITLKGYGYELGEPFVFEYKNKPHRYKIVGFFETPYYGAPYNNYIKYFLTDGLYQQLYEEVGALRVLSAKLTDATQAEAFRTDFVDQTGYGEGVSDIFAQGTCLTSKDMKDMATMMMSMVTSMLTAFGVILTLVVLVVIRFRVNENIEMNMKNIGSLEAMGYTSKQVIMSFVLELTVIGSIAAVVATGLAYMLKPLFTDVLTMSCGFVWENKINPMVDMLAIIIVLALVLVITLLAARQIHKIPPVVALRRGIQTHHFKRNWMPIDKLFGSIHIRLACKQLVINVKQNIMMVIVLAIGTFAIGFMSVIYINFALDHTAIYKMVGLELCDVQIKTTSHTNAKEFAKEIGQMAGVRKTNLSDIVQLKVDDIKTQVIVSDDFDKMEVLEVYKGSMPQYDNEIVLTGLLADQLGKTIGDEVRVSLAGKESTYVITGFSQTTNGAGKMGIMDVTGIEKLMPQFKMTLVDVYLEEGVDAARYINQLEHTYKVAQSVIDQSGETEVSDDPYAAVKQKADEKIAKLLAEYGVDSMEYALMIDGEIILSGNSSGYNIEKITNFYEFLQMQLTTYTSMMSGMVTSMLGVTVLMIGAILSLVIKSMIRSRKETYGVYKALGYTTWELMNHMALNFMVVAVVGTIIGSVMTVCLTNPVLSGIFYQLGVTNLSFVVSIGALVGISVGLIVFVYGLSMALAYRIRKISAYELLTE
ncbi:MAG: ABC transporter permease [Cellulosilyticaceae bacterium]